MNYPYVLGLHLKSQMLCRIFHPDICDRIPQGFVRVLTHRSYWNPSKKVFSGPKICPYENGKLKLKNQYYSLFRWNDLQKRFGEPISTVSSNEPVIVTFFADEQK